MFVHSTDRSLEEATKHICPCFFSKLLTNSLFSECRTGEVRVSQGHGLPSRFIVHTVGPKYNIKYQSAAESTLHACYRWVGDPVAPVQPDARILQVDLSHISFALPLPVESRDIRSSAVKLIPRPCHRRRQEFIMEWRNVRRVLISAFNLTV